MDTVTKKKTPAEIAEYLRENCAIEMRDPRLRGSVLIRAIREGGYEDEIEIQDMKIVVLEAYSGKTVGRIA